MRVQALTDSAEAFGSTLEREMARTEEDWRKWIAPGVTFFVLADGAPRGLVAGVYDAQDRDRRAFDGDVGIPLIRGSGAADSLVTSVKEWAAEVGASEVRLNVVESNARARRCYERGGFRITGRRGTVGKVRRSRDRDDVASGDVTVRVAAES